MKAKIDADEWLNKFEQELKDVTVKPCLVSGAAFPLGSELMKNYHTNNHSHLKRFNAALTKTRQKIEIAFGSLEGRWHILTDNGVRDPAFIRDISLVCESLPLRKGQLSLPCFMECCHSKLRSSWAPPPANVNS